MIEVLIAMLVLAIGLLGMAGLQLNGTKTNFEAMQRSTASAVVQEIMERMRANPSALSSYAITSIGQTTPTAIDCESSACTVSQIAAYDLSEWHGVVTGASASDKGGLVDPTGCIEIDEPAAGYVTVTIVWRGATEIEQDTAVTCGGDLSGDSLSERRVFQVIGYVDG